MNPIRRPLCVRSVILGLTLLASLPVAHGHGAFHERLAALDRALAQSPGDAALLFQRAELLLGHEEPAAALECLDQVDTLAPGGFPTLRLRAQAALATGQPALARRQLETCLAQHADDTLARRLLARAATALGDTRAAAAAYRTLWLATAHPDNELTCEVSDALVPTEADQALAVLERGLGELGPLPSLLLRALDCDLMLARYDEALRHVETLRTLSPRPETWMARRAEILVQAGRPAEARAAWQTLATHLAALPNLERGTPSMRALAARATTALTAAADLPPR